MKQTAVLPVSRGKHDRKTVWFIMTDASDLGVARDLNIMYAPKLANMAIGCPKCVQTVRLEPVPKDNTFAEAIVDFAGARKPAAPAALGSSTTLGVADEAPTTTDS